MLSFLVSGATKNRLLHSSTSLDDSALNDRVVVLETEMNGGKKELQEIKDLSKEVRVGNERMSKEIRERYEIVREGNEKFSKEIKDVII